MTHVQSDSLPADKLAQVTARVKVAGSQVSELDKAGGSNDKATVAADFMILTDTLASLRAIYFGPAQGK